MEVADEEPRIPTPQERLRHAFSSEIPENMMERQGADPYARSDSPELWRDPESPATPRCAWWNVTAGAGVNAVNRMVEAEVEGVEFLAINTVPVSGVSEGEEENGRADVSTTANEGRSLNVQGLLLIVSGRKGVG